MIMHSAVFRRAAALILSAAFLFCFAGASFAAQMKNEREAADFFGEALKNTYKAKNLSFDYSLNLVSPFADMDLKFSGKYAEPMSLSGELSMLLDIWINDSKANIGGVIYAQEEDSDMFVQYVKINSDIPSAIGFEPNKWYVQKTKLKQPVSEFLSQYKESEARSMLENIKYIYMYDLNENQARIHFVYAKPLLTEEKLKRLSSFQFDSKQTEKIQADWLDKMKKYPALKAALEKPRDITCTVIVDKNSMQIAQADCDLTDYLRGLAPEVIDSMPIKEQLPSDPDPCFNLEMLARILKNYIARTSCKMSVKIYDINETAADIPPREIKEQAVPLPDNSADSTDETKENMQQSSNE